MPIYEYRCTDCGKVFEYTQRMTDDPKTECESCAGRLERLISATSFHLKGGGWYKDLYASPKKDGGGTGGGDSASSGKSEGSGSAKSESPATGGSTGGETKSKSGETKSKKGSSDA